MAERDDLVPLDLVRPDAAALVGGKAATLARLRAAGFPVPDGFVVPACAGLDDRADEVRKAAADLGGGPFAVRSSAVDEDGERDSHAGQFTTVLGVDPGVEGDPALLVAIQRCRASGDAAHVHAYRAARGLPAATSVAVLVQQLVSAEAAGVAFTADPVTGDRTRTLVNAVRGLGDRLVDGSVDGELWVVSAGTVARRAGVEDAIDAEQARAVAALAERVAAHEGAPQDIEWAWADGRPYLLQARPITTLPDPVPDADPDVAPVPVPVEPPPGYWTREDSHSPQPWTPFMRELFTVRNPSTRHMAAEFGFLLDSAAMCDIGGWEYMRLVPLGGRDRRRPPDRLMPLLVRLAPALRARVRDCVAAMRADRSGQLIRVWHDSWVGEFGCEIARLRDLDLAALTDEGLDLHLGEVRAFYDRGCLVHMRLHGAIMIALGELAAACEDLLGWDDAAMFALLGGLSVRSTEPAHRLAPLAALAGARSGVRALLDDPQAAAGGLPAGTDPEFAAAFAAYLRECGCRGLRYEVAEQTLAERPDMVLGLVRDQLVGGYEPQAEAAAQTARRAEAVASARRLLAARPTADRARFEDALTRAERAYPVREDNEFFTVSAPTALIRMAALEAGRRLADRGQLRHHDDVFYLEPDEVRAVLCSGADRRDTITRRRGERAWTLAHPGPPSYGVDPGPPPSMDALPDEARRAMRALFWAIDRIFATGRGGQCDGQSLRGLPASPGRYTGPVRIVASEAEFDRIRAGDVLVCPITSPVWSILFPGIGALVTDSGGALSHSAIIAREFRVPAVVATGQATSLLRDGELVTVDGAAGTVERAR